jgi:hypothetical protein
VVVAAGERWNLGAEGVVVAAGERWNLGAEGVVVAAGEPIPVPGRGDRTYPFRAHSEYLG